MSLKRMLLWMIVGSIVFLVVATMILRMYTNSLVRQIETTYPPSGQFIKLNEQWSHYVRKGHGAPVVLLHGNAGSVHDFTMTVFDRVAARFDAIAIDRPGHGYSDRPSDTNLTPDVQAQWLHKMLSQLGVQRPVIVGYSWSGALALAYALRYPNEAAGLVLVAPVAYPDSAFDAPLFRLAQVPLVGDGILGAFVTPFAQVIAAPSLQAAFAPAPVPIDYAQVATYLWLRPSQVKAMAQDVAVLNPALKQFGARYGHIRVPTVIVTGDADTMDPPARHALPLHQAIPNARLVVIPGAGHMLLHSHRAAILEAIEWVAMRAATRTQAALD